MSGRNKDDAGEIRMSGRNKDDAGEIRMMREK